MAVFDSRRPIAPVGAKGEFHAVWRSQLAKSISFVCYNSKRAIRCRTSFSLENSRWNVKLDYSRSAILCRQRATNFHYQSNSCGRQRARPRVNRVLGLNHLDGESGEEAATCRDSTEQVSSDDNSGKAISIDLQLPRRRLLVEFTCDVCQTRTQRLVNPEAYRSGTVYVQCGGCETYHKLVDNLGLVVEYDFRNEADANST